MLIFKNSAHLTPHIAALKGEGKRIGFVPTMGALHEGHLSLVRLAAEENDITIVSIFVNPTQFNDPADLAKYPRTTEADIEKLLGEKTDVLYLPGEQDIYPNEAARRPRHDFGALEQVMEGAQRPGHFKGVALVVSRLLDVTLPDVLYLGQKDYQQWLILSELARQENRPLKVVRAPIAREPNDLAMSSRNERLTPADRQRAAVLYRNLQRAAAEIKKGTPPAQAAAAAAKAIAAEEPSAKVAYVEAADAATLRPATNSNASIVLCGAVIIGGVRLIDNVVV